MTKQNPNAQGNGANILPSAEVLREMYDYNPETGKLYFRPKPGTGRAINSFNAKYAGKEAFTWTDKDGYRRSEIRGRSVPAHRVIWKMVHGVDPQEIDHINHDRADNRIVNLRDVTRSENLKNATPRNVSGEVQVRRYGATRFRVTAHFDTLEEALAAERAIKAAVA